MRKLKLLFLLLALVTITPPTWAQYSSGDCGEDLTWEYDEGTYTLTISGSGDMYWAGKNANKAFRLNLWLD